MDEKVSRLRKIASTMCKKVSKESLLDIPEYQKVSIEYLNHSNEALKASWVNS
jgi:hypothetical protein